MSDVKRKKNCLNCRHGYYESYDEYGSSYYFACDKREDDGRNNLEENLRKDSYLKKSKVCCELSVQPVSANCSVCGEIDTCWPEDVDTHICFDCYVCGSLKDMEDSQCQN